MTTIVPMLGTQRSPYDSYRLAEELFEQRDYYTAATVLTELIEEQVAAEGDGPALNSARELLARSYYHSAQVAKAVEAARVLLARDPGNDYAARLLARSLQRQPGKDDAARAEAAGAARLAAAMRG